MFTSIPMGVGCVVLVEVKCTPTVSDLLDNPLKLCIFCIFPDLTVNLKTLQRF